MNETEQPRKSVLQWETEWRKQLKTIFGKTEF